MGALDALVVLAGEGTRKDACPARLASDDFSYSALIVNAVPAQLKDSCHRASIEEALGQGKAVCLRQWQRDDNDGYWNNGTVLAAITRQQAYDILTSAWAVGRAERVYDSEIILFEASGTNTRGQKVSAERRGYAGKCSVSIAADDTKKVDVDIRTDLDPRPDWIDSRDCL